MHRPIATMFLLGIIGLTSCHKDDPRDLSHRHAKASPLAPLEVAGDGDSCDFPPLRRPVPRFLPGPDCAMREPTRERVSLPIEVRMQQCRLWCWSSSLSAVAAYNGTVLLPCEFASLGTGKTCCVMEPCAAPGCDVRLPSAKVSDLLAKAEIASEHVERPLTEPELRREIASGRPVLVVTVNAAGDKHMTVAYGYDRQLYSLLDPDPMACGGGDFRYQALLHSQDGAWHWTESWKLTSKKPGACPAP